MVISDVSDLGVLENKLDAMICFFLTFDALGLGRLDEAVQVTRS